MNLGVLTALLVAGLRRWVRAQVRVDQSGLTLRTPLPTHRLPWSRVRRADIVPSNAQRLFALIKGTTNDGRTIKVDGVGCRWRRYGFAGTPVAQTVDLINTYTHAASCRD